LAWILPSVSYHVRLSPAVSHPAEQVQCRFTGYHRLIQSAAVQMADAEIGIEGPEKVSVARSLRHLQSDAEHLLGFVKAGAVHQRIAQI
jgi:hypothetical protein